MNKPQRAMLIGSSLSIAVASALYSLEYRELDGYRSAQGRLVEIRLNEPLRDLPPALIKFDERSSARFSGSGFVTVSGLYPRSGLDFGEGVLGGLLVPILLTIVAMYLALGASRTRREAAKVASPAWTWAPPPAGQPAPAAIASEGGNAKEWTARMATVAIVILPLLYVLDMPSVMLAMRFRFPRRVFAVLVFRALGNALHH